MEGGIRLPQFVVPTAEQGALNGTAFPCNVSGWHRYYTKQELKAMYGTHGRYVAKVLGVMYPLVAEGYVLWTDAFSCRSRRRAVRRREVVAEDGLAHRESTL